MSIETMMSDTVYVITPTMSTDSRGAASKSWVGAPEVASRAWMAQTNASSPDDELTPNREGTLTEWRCFLPYPTTLDNRCRIRYLGDLYEVVGEVHIAKTTSGPHHLEVPLKKCKG